MNEKNYFILNCYIRNFSDKDTKTAKLKESRFNEMLKRLSFLVG